MFKSILEISAVLHLWPRTIKTNTVSVMLDFDFSGFGILAYPTILVHNVFLSSFTIR